MNNFDINKIEAIKLFASGKHVKAIRYFTDALQIKPFDVECLIKRSCCYLNDGQIDKAIIDAHIAVDRNPKNQKAIYQKAEVYYIKGEFEKALLLYHNGRQLRPDDDKFRLGIQRSEMAIGNCLGKGSSFHINGEADESSILSDKDEVVIQKPTRPQLRGLKMLKELIHELSLDRYYLEEMVIDEENRLHKFKEINPNEFLRKGSRIVKNRKMEYYNRAAFKTNFCSMNIIKKAQHCINYLDPRSDFWQQHEPFYSRKKHRRQLRLKSTSFSKDRSKWTAHNVLLEMVHIEMLGFQRDYIKAIDKAKNIVNILEDVHGIEGQNSKIILSDLYSIIGNAYFQMGNYKDALKYHELDRINGINNNIKDSVSRSMDYLGIIHFLRDEYELAIKIWNKKIKFALTNLEVSWLNHEIGRAYLALENYNMAFIYATRSLEKANLGMDENWQLNAHILLGKILYHLNKMPECIDMYKKAVDISKILKLNGVEEELTKLIQHHLLNPRIVERPSTARFQGSVKLASLKDFHSKSASFNEPVARCTEKKRSLSKSSDENETVRSFCSDSENMGMKFSELKRLSKESISLNCDTVEKDSSSSHS